MFAREFLFDTVRGWCWRRCLVRWLTRGVGVETILHNQETRHNRVLKWDIGRTFIGDDFSHALFPLCNVEKGK